MNSNLLRAAAIGNFDGVHRGHQLLVDTLIANARERGLAPTVFVLDRHPLELVDPPRAPGRLMSLEEKIYALAPLGVEVTPIRFDETTRGMTSLEYMTLLRDKYNVRLLVVGYDNRFGSDRESDIDTYCAHGGRLGMTVIEAPCLPGVSSSAIRRMLLCGDVVSAKNALGRPYRLTGRVIHGFGRGAKLGFPTANITMSDPRTLIPGGGVYAASAILQDATRTRAMINIGTCPTFGDSTVQTIEASLIDFSGDLYGQSLSLEFVSRIRDERKMKSPTDLIHQLESDQCAVLSLPDNLFS